jgi:sn-glycerol 3-phosphate transport system permease protein
LEVVALLALALIFVFPFVWMFLTSLKALDEVMIFPPQWLPAEPRWENFREAWESGPFFSYFLNSLLVAVTILMLQFATGIPAAYAFARLRFRGAGLLFGITLLALMIPPQLTFLPVFIQMSEWDLLNSYLPLILPYAASAFGIFL